ncbi:hypothetical protein G6F35_017102 [Rhizopus arrhizus]|nr:hypothetical protein G6F35_017102 [Rhizopus arrhizus]
MEVPAITRVKGTNATSRMMNGNERTVFTVQLSSRCTTGRSSDCPGPVRNTSTPRGPPRRIDAASAIASIRKVWPPATPSSGSNCTKVSSIMRPLRRGGWLRG